MWGKKMKEIYLNDLNIELKKLLNGKWIESDSDTYIDVYKRQ